MIDRRRNSVFYMGQSMSPLFREGDDIQFRSCADRPVRRGDVVVFTPPGESRLVIHRVIGIGPEGIRTRGDRNSSPDPWLLEKGAILGIAVRSRRRGKDRAISRGIGGRLHSAAASFLLDLRARAVQALDPLLKGGSCSGLFVAWVPDRYRPRVLAISRPEGTEFMLLMGRHVAGRRFAGNKFWQIRKRYQPFVNLQAIQKGPS